MPITGRSIAGAGLMGLGEGLQQWSAQTIKRKQIEDEWKFELLKQQLAAENKRQDAQTAGQQALIGNIMKDPGSASAYIAASSIDPAMKGVPIEPIQQLARTVAPRLISQQLLTAPTTEAMGADLGRRFTNATGQDYGSIPLQPQFDLQALGGEQPDRAIPPDLQSALSDALTRAAQLRQAEQDKIAQAGELEQSKEGGKTTGKLTAEHALAPQTVQDAVDAITAEAGPKADAAGQAKHAELLAGVAPDVIAGGAQKITADRLAGLTPAITAAEAHQAGAKKGAEDRAAAAVKYDPANMANEVTLAVNKASALAKAKGDTARQKYITDAQVGVMRLAPQLAVMKDLYDRAIKGDYQAAKLYHDKIASLAAPIAMATGYTGRMTVQEMQNVSGLLPSLAADTVLGTADEKWKNLSATMRYGPLVAAQLPEGATVSDTLAAVQALVDREKQDRQGQGAVSGAAPATPAPTPRRHFDFDPLTNSTVPRD